MGNTPMNLPNRYPYQEYQFQRILARGGKTAIIGKPGCGKTRPIIDSLHEDGGLGVIDSGQGDSVITFPNGSVFVMCSGPAIATWKRQFPEWVGNPELSSNIHVITGETCKGKPARIAMWKRALTEPGIYLTNFTCFRLDYHVIQQLRWGAIIADEYHKVMRSKKSSTFKMFRSWTRHKKVVMLASGSVLSKEPSSMWTAFTIVEPPLKLFRSYWRYVETFCIIEEGAYGAEIQGVKNTEQLKEIMDRYFAYVPAEVIADQQPEGRRMRMDVEMNAEQRKIYKALTDDMIAVLESGDIIIVPSDMGKVLKLRQLLCCPKILDESLGMGAGYDAILDRLEDQPHCVIFVPFRPAVDYMVEALRLKGYHAEGLKGGIGSVEQQAVVDRFGRNRGIIVCTIAYAESFDLETCDTSYFLGYDFNIAPNEQAEGRTQRAISKHKFVTWQYICHANTVDEYMLMNLEQDMGNMSKVLKRPEDFIRMLKGEMVNS